MVKRGTFPKVDETLPTGDITEAPAPIPVRARVIWNFGGPMVIDNAWAMAWTKSEVHVYWFVHGTNTGMLVWLRSDQVKRR